MSLLFKLIRQQIERQANYNTYWLCWKVAGLCWGRDHIIILLLIPIF